MKCVNSETGKLAFSLIFSQAWLNTFLNREAFCLVVFNIQPEDSGVHAGLIQSLLGGEAYNPKLRLTDSFIHSPSINRRFCLLSNLGLPTWTTFRAATFSGSLGSVLLRKALPTLICTCELADACETACLPCQPENTGNFPPLAPSHEWLSHGHNLNSQQGENFSVVPLGSLTVSIQQTSLSRATWYLILGLITHGRILSGLKVEWSRRLAKS